MSFFDIAGAGPSRAPAKFLEGEKGESFAKAFSKILQHKTKQQKPSSETTNAPVGGEEGPILAVSDPSMTRAMKRSTQFMHYSTILFYSQTLIV